MNVLIIEDEQPAAERLLAALEQTAENIEVQAVLTSVSESIQWLRKHEMPELIIMDIELSDARSFFQQRMMTIGRKPLNITVLTTCLNQ